MAESAEAGGQPQNQLAVALAPLLRTLFLLQLRQGCCIACILPKQLAGLPGRVLRVPKGPCKEACPTLGHYFCLLQCCLRLPVQMLHFSGNVAWMLSFAHSGEGNVCGLQCIRADACHCPSN